MQYASCRDAMQQLVRKCGRPDASDASFRACAERLDVSVGGGDCGGGNARCVLSTDTDTYCVALRGGARSVQVVHGVAAQFGGPSRVEGQSAKSPM